MPWLKGFCSNELHIVMHVQQRQQVLSPARNDSEPSSRFYRQRLARVCAISHSLSAAWSSHEASWTSAVTKQMGSTSPCWYGHWWHNGR